MTKEKTGVLPLTFLVKIENMRESSHSSDGFMLGLGRVEEVSAGGGGGVLTCILAWEPGLSEGQAEGKQQFTTRSGQAQKASL